VHAVIFVNINFLCIVLCFLGEAQAGVSSQSLPLVQVPEPIELSGICWNSFNPDNDGL